MPRSHFLHQDVYLLEGAGIVGPREGQGPLAAFFDEIVKDDKFGKDSFEKAEIEMQIRAAETAMKKADLSADGIDFLFAGDLLNQVIAAGYAARMLKIPFLGLYGACSTMAESMTLASLLLSCGYGGRALCIASSHFSTAERQYRFPLEMGAQRPPSAQWTVTGAGAAILSTREKSPIAVTCVTPGRVIDMGITDANHMGAAMAPAAADTILTHMEETNSRPSDYDAIVTGDLGRYGSDLLMEMLSERGCDIQGRHMDCGSEIFAGMSDDAGGSGCGCCAVTLMGCIRAKMIQREWNRVLFTATGALLSPTIVQQGESIPGIAHSLVLERRNR